MGLSTHSCRALLIAAMSIVAFFTEYRLARAEVCGAEGWCWSHPLPHGEFISDIWGSSATDIWTTTTIGNGDTMLLHFDGTNWEEVREGSVGAGYFYDIYQLFGFSANSVYAVGYKSDGGYIHRYDGTEWSDLELPNALKDSKLTQIWGSSENDLFAAGRAGVVLHFNGTTWSAMTSGTNSDVTAIWGSGANDVYLVADRLRHYDGATWSIVNDVPTNGTGLFDIWGSGASNVYVATEGGGIWHWNGAAWNLEDTALSASDIRAVDGSGAGNVYVLYKDNKVGRFNGATWSLVNDITGRELLDLWIAPNGAALVGGSYGEAYYFNTATWSDVGSDATAEKVVNVKDLWGTSATSMYYVADNTLFKFNGTQWNLAATAPALLTFEGVWSPSDTEAFIVGYNATNGVLAKYDGSSLQILDASAGNVLQAIHGTSPTNVFACGTGGEVRRWNGTSFDLLPTGTTNSLNGIWAASENDVFAVGFAGTILRYNGSTWSKATITDQFGQKPTFEAVWGTSSSNVYAIGFDQIWRFNGTSWKIESTPFINTTNMYDIWGTAADNIWAVGDFATTWRFDGESWQDYSTLVYDRRLNHLKAIWGTSNDKMYAVGSSGAFIFKGSLQPGTPPTPTPTPSPTPPPGTPDTTVKIEGLISDSQGVAAANVVANLNRDGVLYAMDTTGRDGTFSVEAPANSSVTLWFNRTLATFDPDRFEFVTSTSNIDVGTVTIDIDLSGYEQCKAKQNAPLLSKINEVADAVRDLMYDATAIVAELNDTTLSVTAAEIEALVKQAFSELLTQLNELPDIAFRCPKKAGCSQTNERSTVRAATSAVQTIQRQTVRAANLVKRSSKKQSKRIKTKALKLGAKARSLIKRVTAIETTCGG